MEYKNNPGAVQRMGEEALQMSTGNPAPAPGLNAQQIEQLGKTFAREVIEAGGRRIPVLAEKVAARGLSQHEAVGVLQSAINALEDGRHSVVIPQANGTVILSGVNFGVNQPILIINQRGVVSQGTANISYNVRNREVNVSNIQLRPL